MLTTDQWIGVGLIASLIVAAFAGQMALGFSIASAATAFGSVASVLALLLLFHGLQAQTRELAMQRNELPERFEVTVTYTKRNGQEQEERWSITEDAAGFDCAYDGKVAAQGQNRQVAVR